MKLRTTIPARTSTPEKVASTVKILDDKQLARVEGGRNVKNFDKPIRDYYAI